jgi:hypothetical protein
MSNGEVAVPFLTVAGDFEFELSTSAKASTVPKTRPNIPNMVAGAVLRNGARGSPAEDKLQNR